MIPISTNDNLLDLTDQAAFMLERAAGATNLIQMIWIYDRDIDLGSLRRFHENLRRGRLSRRIAPSILPFGRHRWITVDDTSEIEISAPRPRSQMETWLNEQTRTAVDAVTGPGWHLAVLSLTDGGAVLSLVVSHSLTDGIGLFEALKHAISGTQDPIQWSPVPRTRSTALREDLRQFARDLPAVGRAMRAASEMARRDRASGAPKPVSVPAERPDEQITIPAVSVIIDGADWDTAIDRLGGTDNALLGGIGADLGQRMGRVDPVDCTVALDIPVSLRVENDPRANAVASVTAVVNPAGATTDLRAIRAAMKTALIGSQDGPADRWAVLPLFPLIPKPLFRRMLGQATGGSSRTVIVSNSGLMDPALNRPDGTDADRFMSRTLYPGMTRGSLHRAGGVLALLSGRINGHVSLSAQCYLPGQANSVEDLRQALTETLAAFGLPWSQPWPTSPAV